MSQRRRQLALLGVLLVALVFFVVGPFVGGRRSAGAGLAGAGAGSQVAAGLGEEVVALDLERLEQKPGGYQPGRNPFRFQAPRRAQPPPRPQPRPTPPRPAQAQRPAPRQAAGPPKPQPPPIDFKYLGSFGTSQRKIAVFSDQAEIYNAREGEVIKEKFVVQEIGYESADIGFVDFPDEPTQRLAVGG